MKIPNKNRGIFLLIFSQVAIGLSSIIIKLINPDFSSLLLNFLLFFPAGFLLLLTSLVNKNLKKQINSLLLKEVIGLISLGIIAVGLAGLFVILSIRNIGAGLTMIITNLQIVVSIFFGYFILKEKLTKRYIGIAIFLFFGFLLILINNNLVFSLSSSFFYGVMMSLSAAFFWGICTIIGKILLNKKISPIIIAGFRAFFGGLFNLIIVFFSLSNIASRFISLRPLDWLAIVIFNIILTILGNIAFYEALESIEVKHVSLFYTLPTIVSVILGIMLGEFYSLRQIIGIVIVLLCLNLMMKENK